MLSTMYTCTCMGNYYCLKSTYPLVRSHSGHKALVKGISLLVIQNLSLLYLVLFIIDTPKIVEHPQAQVLEVGNKLFLTCQAQGVGPLNYQWFRNGEALIYGTKQDLVINEVQMADQGVYVCCVKTSNGSSALTKGAEIVGQFVVVPPGLGVENKFLLFDIYTHVQ